MRLLLVRHGESVCGVSGIIGGERGCTGLTDRGFAQARALRDRFAGEGLVAEALLASTLPRAHQTAAVLSEALGLDVVRDADLCEFVPGSIDGSLWDDWTDRFDVSEHPDRPLSPGGESLRRFNGRVRGLLDRLAATHDGQTVVAACHGGIVWASRRLLREMDDPDVPVDHTSITEWTHTEGRWELVRLNDVGHLEGTDLLPASA